MRTIIAIYDLENSQKYIDRYGNFWIYNLVYRREPDVWSYFHVDVQSKYRVDRISRIAVVPI